MHIVAMAAGYIDTPPTELVIAPRKQVLVAVTSNWQVLCLDHNLKLQWETAILVRTAVLVIDRLQTCSEGLACTLLDPPTISRSDGD